MTESHFKAIIAKNSIAEEIKDFRIHGDKGLAIDYILDCLREIEIYIGEGNQPSVNDIIKTL